MYTVTVDDIKRFAERVERLCDFLLEGMNKDGSADVDVILKLKKDAVSLQDIKQNSNMSIQGLDEYMRGIPKNV